MKPGREALETLRERLREAEETLDAIRSGEVDALMVRDPTSGQEKLFTVQGADFAFRTMLEQMADGAASASRDGTVLYANAALARMCGRPIQRLIGSDVRELVVPEDRSRLREALRDAERRTARLEVTLRLGQPPALLTLSPLSGYEPRAVALVATDLSAQIRNVELERRVGERTAALRAANRELEAFNYSVSHDLKAPARQLMLFAELLEREHAAALGDDGARMLASIKSGAARLAAIINGMLALSRTTLSELDYKEVDLSALCRAIVEELRRAEPERRVKVSIAPGMTVRGDEDLLRLALQNLLANAWKFTSRRRAARIDVSFADRAEKIVRVRDNGAGFDARYAEKIFQPFQRLHAATDYPGTGIGLSIVQRVLARHGGRAWAKGAAGRGAQFYFQLGRPGAALP